MSSNRVQRDKPFKSIGTEAALKVPGVLAVVTAKELEPLSLHWMPTLAGDMAAVLADKKVHFQNQEIAFVVATDRYAATDGVQKVEVEYEALPPLGARRRCARDSR